MSCALDPPLIEVSLYEKTGRCTSARIFIELELTLMSVDTIQRTF